MDRKHERWARLKQRAAQQQARNPARVVAGSDLLSDELLMVLAGEMQGDAAPGPDLVRLMATELLAHRRSK